MKKISTTILAALLFLCFMPKSEFKVSGIVTDEKGAPIAHASILVMSTRIGTAADANGAYRLTVPSKSSILLFNAVGYEPKKVKVKGASKINVTLKQSVQKLMDVVVTAGYGSVKKRAFTGSESTVSVALQGVASGVSASNGAPGTWDGNSEEESDTEDYDNINENIFHKATDNPLSTFSIDVDAGSYSNVRRFLKSKQLPPAGAVRIEEMINYFRYDYPQPKNEHPFSFTTETSECPWNSDHRLVMIGLQGKKIPVENLPPSNLVFLIDVSGSMNEENKLPLVKSSLKLLTDQLREEDMVSIVVYAGAAGLVLSPTSGAEKAIINSAIDRSNAGGSTAGGEGIRLAYKTANQFFKKSGNNRVILCTDGDFNVGVSSDDEMERLIEKERVSGVFLTVLGYGMGNYKDNKMQKLADKGNGNHAYIDDISEAKKVLVNEFGGTLFTIAKDVKLQIEFNPSKVQGYRLIGYENRMLRKEDFNDDKKDAGELGSGHTVTALYEIIPVGIKSSFLKDVDPLKYQPPVPVKLKHDNSSELMTIKFRYKEPDASTTKLIIHPVYDKSISLKNVSDNFLFAMAVAEFGMILKNSEFRNNATYDNVVALAGKAKGKDKEGYRSEFISLVEIAKELADLAIKRK